MHFSLRPHGSRRERGARGTVYLFPPRPRTVGSSGRRKALWESDATFLCSHAAPSMVFLVAGIWEVVVAWDLGSPRQPLAYAPFPENGEMARTRWPFEEHDPPDPA